MTPERWNEIERVYHAALRQPASERPAYLAEACGGDEALRAEVESLLRYEQDAARFIEPAQPDLSTGALAKVDQQSPIAGMMARLRDATDPGRFAGRVLGSYEVKSLIAAGGMGEVYRAIDTRLDRVVALKILPPHFSDDPERRERFTREARIVSSLNHPHICALYDVGDQDGTQFLVMEHIDGETLQARIQRGRIPLALALEYLIQMADALDKAHRRGIVHRDLKPGNVMLTKSGVKLLDFGLAARRGGSGAVRADSGALTTGSAEIVTVTGRIMGTVQYMAPEQLQGRPSDARSDIFAFGAVAYEMLTGTPAFAGESQAALIGAILRDEPRPMIELVPEIPPALARTLVRCLTKDPDERWQTANDLLFQLRALNASSDVGIVAGRTQPRRSPWRERAAWLAVLGALSVGAWYWGRQVEPERESTPAVTRVEFTVSPAEGTLMSGPDVPFALAPDGQSIAYVAVDRHGTTTLAVQSLGSDAYKPLPGTEGASMPFWSPDSQWIAFFAANSLKKVRVSTGLAQTIAHGVSSTLSGASWGVHDDIVFSSFVGTLTRVAATGGPLTDLRTERAFSPQFLPDGKHLLFATGSTPSIRVVTLGEERSQTLMSFPVRTSPIAYGSGHVFFVQDDTLYARPFDPQRLAFSGAAMRIADNVPTLTPARAPFSVSNGGIVAYSTFPLGAPAILRWFDRTGRPGATVGTPRLYRGFDMSTDGQRIVFSRNSSAGSALWTRDPASATDTQLTFDESFAPQLSADGSRLLFSGPGAAPPPKLFVRSLANASASLVATPSTADVANFASDWSGDGTSAVSVRIDRTQRLDVWQQLLPNGPDERLPFNTSFNESHAKVSPDNRWIAFVTDRSGKDEVWIADFPSGEHPRALSREGGSLPQWSAGGKELVYVTEDKRLVAVPFDGGVAGTPELLFRVDHLLDIDRFVMPTANVYVPTGDGKRFLVAERTHDPNLPPIKIIVNWWASRQQ
jgi:serine/threonine protein kinase/Tol biopolymer transport system component